MTDQQAGEQLQRLFTDLGEALRAAFAEIADQFNLAYEALGGGEGVAALTAGLTAALEQRDAAREQWEAEHPGLRYGQDCHCFCQRWGHRGICAATATTYQVMTLWGEPVQVAMCEPCSSHVTLLTAAAGR